MDRNEKRSAITGALIALLLLALTVTWAPASTDSPAFTIHEGGEPSFYVGVTFGGNATAEAKLLIDRVKRFTNLFVIQSGPVSRNETAMTEISEYAIDAGLHLIVYFGWFDPQQPWQLPWLNNAKRRWGEKFLGVYFDDEPSGIPLDYNWTGFFTAQKQQNSTVY